MPVASTSVGPIQVVAALNEFSECVRYLNTRRSAGASFVAPEDEAGVQDALYLMLRPWVHDLTWESPGDKVANSFTIKDFLSKSARLVIEAKYIRDAAHGKSITKELNDDIENYRYHPSCDDLIFFIYDPNSYIPDGGQLRAHIVQDRQYGMRVLRCHAVIKP